MDRNEVIGVIKDFSGTVNQNGEWFGDPVVAPLITRVYRAAPDILLNQDEEECKVSIVRVVRQLTGVVIPKKYDSVFWSSAEAKIVTEKLNKKLPQLPEVRKS
jgi:hypothetical protein